MQRQQQQGPDGVQEPGTGLQRANFSGEGVARMEEQLSMCATYQAVLQPGPAHLSCKGSSAGTQLYELCVKQHDICARPPVN